MRDDPAVAARLGRVARDYYIFGNKTTVFDDKPEVIWLYGATGQGKSFLAASYFERLRQEDQTITFFVHLPGSLKWWDGYEGQHYVILDDFRRSQLKEVGGFSYLLRLLDRYTLRLEVKGGSVVRAWHHIIITCPRSPVDEFTYHGGEGERLEEDIAQLVRRCDRIVRVGTVGAERALVDETGLFWSRNGLGLPPETVGFDMVLRTQSQ